MQQSSVAVKDLVNKPGCMERAGSDDTACMLLHLRVVLMPSCTCQTAQPIRRREKWVRGAGIAPSAFGSALQRPPSKGFDGQECLCRPFKKARVEQNGNGHAALHADPAGTEFRAQGSKAFFSSNSKPGEPAGITCEVHSDTGFPLVGKDCCSVPGSILYPAQSEASVAETEQR